jgi:serine/threonine-protein kinase
MSGSDMSHPLLDAQSVDQPPAEYLAGLGHVLAVFDERTQDSGNVSYGVLVAGQRYFVKTAGRPDDPRPFLSHAQRVDLLRNGVKVWQSCQHPAMPRVYNLIETPPRPMVVCEWAEGELLRCPADRRGDPASTFQRFLRLPVERVLRVLDVIYDLHDLLGRQAWIAVDFYDGCVVYDFARDQVRIMDLDHYHQGPFVNEMGRMFGSSRFMAPEEFQRGARIDQRTNVFTMGRAAAVLLGDGTLDRKPFRASDALYEVVRHACEPEPDHRFPSVKAFRQAWCAARARDLERQPDA